MGSRRVGQDWATDTLTFTSSFFYLKSCVSIAESVKLTLCYLRARSHLHSDLRSLPGMWSSRLTLFPVLPVALASLALWHVSEASRPEDLFWRLSGDYRWITHLKCLTLKHKNAREWKPGAFKLYIHCLSNLPNHSYRSVSSLTEHSSQGARLLSGICEFSKITGKVWFCCDF